MKQLVMLSGKGGTGKTSVSAAFADLASRDSRIRTVLADGDVDASNLELVLHPRRLEEHEFTGGSVAVIDPQRCEACGTCAEVCRFDAVVEPEPSQAEPYRVDPIACEGCAACVYSCPTEAIQMIPQKAGFWYRSDTEYGPLFHAFLLPGQENSGKLVTLVKQQARLFALEGEYDLQIVDGPPGIGCPVISAISGADLALIVAEPTLSGVHDMQRILETAAHFQVAACVCINKADLYPDGAAQIESFCRENQIEVVGHIPFDASVTKSMVLGEPVTRFLLDAPASQAFVKIWEHISRMLLL